MDTWGKIKTYPITDSNDFWALFDELVDDDSKFIHNRNTILDAYTRGTLFGLRVTETDAMFENRERNNRVFCKGTYYMLPCFCIKDSSSAVIIWVHTRARRNGFGRILVEQLGITNAYCPLPESIPFWEKCGISIE